MICAKCKGLFNEANFEICPYCLEPFELTLEFDNINHIDFNSNEESIPREDTTINTSRKILIKDLNELSMRAFNALSRNQIFTINDLIAFLEKNNIEDVKNVGVMTANEIKDFARKYEDSDNIYFEEYLCCSDDETILIKKGIKPWYYMFQDIDKSNESLPIDAVKLVGFAPQAIKTLKEANIRRFSQMKEISNIHIEHKISKLNIIKLEELAEILKRPAKLALKQFFEGEVNKKEFEIYLRRADGETLQEIADNPSGLEDKVTRERVRQIEKKYYLKIYPIVKHVAVSIMEGKDYLLSSDISEAYNESGFDRVFIYTCKRMEEFEYLDFADAFVLKESKLKEENLLEIMKDYIGDAINLYENLEELENMLASYGYEFIDLGRIINFVHKYNYTVRGEFVFYGRPTYGIMCANIIKTNFPNGIKINQNDDVPGEELSKLREIVFEEFGDIGLPVSDRALSARISDYTVISDRGKVIHPECIQIDESLIRDIKRYVDKIDNVQIYYAEIFSEFEGILLMTSNVDNHNFLHGVFQLYYPDEYDYSRDYLIKQFNSIEIPATISERINKFIIKMGRPISKNELIGEFAGLSDTVLFVAISNDEKLMQWEYNYFSSIDLIYYDINDVINLKEILIETLRENKGYSSDMNYYKKVKSKYNHFLIQNYIKSEMNLFYVISNLLKDNFDFRRPHIVIKGKYEIISSKDIILEMMQYPKNIRYDNFMKLAEELEWASVTSGVVFKEIEQDYYRVSKNEYIIKDNFIIEKEKLDEIYKIIINRFEYSIMPVYGIDDYDDFPEIGYKWNEFILGTILESMYEDITLINPIVVDRRYQKGIATLKQNNLNSYSEIIANVMMENNFESLSESKMLSFLIVNDLARNTIPKELMTSEYVKFINNEYVITV